MQVRNQSYLRRKNKKSIIELLRKRAQSYSDLARELKLSNTAIANIVDDLIEQLRAAGYFDPSEVLFAVVETTGSLSVYPRFAARPATGGDLGLHRDDFIDAPPVVIVDQGRVLPASLDYCGVSPVWLQKALEQEGIAQKDIFLMICDRRRKYHIVKKDKT